jgi:hypothetical protein
MSRKKDICEKLDYADQRFNELCEKIFEGGMNLTEVKFISVMAGDVLSGSREVFDYCANDIVDVHISPNESGIAAALTNSKLRCYYHFYKTQLTKGNNVFSTLKKFNKPLHSYLFSIAASIETNKPRPGTLMNYGLLRDMADMVNQKKHDKLLAVEPSGGETVYSQSRSVQLMIPKEQQIGVSYIELPPDATHRIGTTYVFDFNKKDLMTFTMMCKNLSRLVMDDIYNMFLP